MYENATRAKMEKLFALVSDRSVSAQRAGKTYYQVRCEELKLQMKEMLDEGSRQMSKRAILESVPLEDRNTLSCLGLRMEIWQEDMNGWKSQVEARLRNLEFRQSEGYAPALETSAKVLEQAAEIAHLHEKYRHDLNEAAGTIKELQEDLERAMVAKAEMAATIGDLREKLEVAKAQANIAESARASVSEVALKYEADAKLGAMVRQMPVGHYLTHNSKGWDYANGSTRIYGATPDHCLQQFIDKVTKNE